MAIGPQRPAGTVDPRLDALISQMPVEEVFVKNSSGILEGSGLLINSMKTPNTILGVDGNGVWKSFQLSPLAQQIVASNSEQMIRGILGIEIPTAVSELTNDSGYITSSSLPVLATVATTGSYTDLVNKPTAVGQVNTDWNSTSGVSQLLNKPVLATVATSGSYNDLSNQPTIPTVNYPVTSVNTKTGAVVLSNTDVGAAATVHTHVIGDVTGLQSALDSKISTGASIAYSTLTGTPTIPVNNNFTFKGLSDTDDTAIANGYLAWNSAGTSVSYSTTIPFTSLSGKPTTLSGYGITDAVTSSSLTSTLASYVTSSSLTTSLSSYVTNSSLTTSLAGYATTTALTTGLSGKFNIPTGTTAQYVRGDGTLATLPVIPTTVSSFTNDAAYLTTINNSQVIAAIGFTPYNATNPSAYITQAQARTSVSLTTTGTGAASYNNTTGVLNVPTPNTSSQSANTRSLNTAFQVSTTRNSLVVYSVQMTVTASITSGQNGDIILEIASDSGFTTNVQTLSIAGLSQVYTLAVAIQGVQGQTSTITGFIPSGYYARIRTVSTTGTPTFAIRAGQETLM